MLQRIGRAKPSYFAKLDMTWGYWQAPLHEHTKRFTAFITYMGIFEWNRAPMGTQAAGGYFHQCISYIVLAGLVYNILEAYIDDIIIHAPTEAELFSRLQQVFERFRKYKIKFNPDKVFIIDTSCDAHALPQVPYRSSWALTRQPSCHLYIIYVHNISFALYNIFYA